MHKLSELRGKISVKTEYVGKDIFYVAHCPLCFRHKEETRAGRSPYSKGVTVGKVITHLKLSHAAEVTDDISSEGE
jgi:hypothetical protein